MNDVVNIRVLIEDLVECLLVGDVDIVKVRPLPAD